MTSGTWRQRGAVARAGTVSCLTLLALGVPAAWGHGGHDHFGAASLKRAAAVRQALGQGAERAASGLYRVAPERGKPVLTHGPDVRAYTGGEPGFRPGDPERMPVCADDYYQHVIYAHPAGPLPSDAATGIAEIRAIMRRSNAVLNADSLASGGPSADYKVRCDGSGRIQVDAVGVGGLDFHSVIDSIRALDLFDRRADYTVFLDAGGADFCGIGSYIADESPGADNANNSGGAFAVITRNCWRSAAPMHENGHNQGAVQYGSPTSTGIGAHCNVDHDVMCYSPDGGDLRQNGTTLRCGERVHFDCGYDDYFDSAPEPGEYLATHWNLGSPSNRFIRFSEPTGDDPPPAVETPKTSVPPTVVITRKPSPTVKTKRKARKVRFRFSSSDDGAAYRCRFDRRRWKQCGSPYQMRLRRGRHVFRVRAIDADGNKSSVERAVVRIEKKRR